MDVHFTEGIQLGVDRGVTFLFEERLVAMAAILGRPLTELRGGQVYGAPLEGDWYAECVIRTPLATPSSEVFIFRTVDRLWNEAAVRVIQESIARLASLRDYLFLGTQFEEVGRRDEDGIPVPFTPGSASQSSHQEDVEILLHRTQHRLDVARVSQHAIIVANHVLVDRKSVV